MAETSGDKTHQATPYRRRKAREEGQVAKSQDLASAIVLLGAIVSIMWLGQGMARTVATLFERQLGTVPELAWDRDAFLAQASILLGLVARATLPYLGTLLLIAAGAHLGQAGWLFVPQKLAPEWSRISPWRGIVRVVSMSNAVRLVLGMAKVVAVGMAAAGSIYYQRNEIVGLGTLAFRQQCVQIVDVLLSTSLHAAVVLLLLAVLDYAYQRWKFEQDLRMTTQEMRDEYKMLQGDPQIAARRKQVQRQIAESRLAVAVPKADVVVTNPTELAIALQYDPQTMEAPVVLAKGAGHLAARIRRMALEQGVPIVERKELARALYRHVDVNRPIPAQHYAAVAEVLKYVYELKGKTLPPSAGRGNS